MEPGLQALQPLVPDFQKRDAQINCPSTWREALRILQTMTVTHNWGLKTSNSIKNSPLTHQDKFSSQIFQFFSLKANFRTIPPLPFSEHVLNFFFLSCLFPMIRAPFPRVLTFQQVLNIP